MNARKYEKSSEFQCPARDLWTFHMRSEALEVLAPPLSGFRVIDPGEGVADGSVLTAEVGVWPFRSRWKALHCGLQPGRAFTDVALEAPFPYWVHHHRVEELGPQRSRLIDSVRFVAPRWLPGRAGAALVSWGLGLFFAWRHRATRRWLAAHARDGRDLDRVRGDLVEGGCS
jgi:ligand-binding SRPBCC domain-containing protein